jgi:hypothetical protein
MKNSEFETLPLNKIYEFITYADEKIIGIPYVDYAQSVSTINKRYYIVPGNKIMQLNQGGLTLEQKLNEGVFIPINPDVIDVINIVR